LHIAFLYKLGTLYNEHLWIYFYAALKKTPHIANYLLKEVVQMRKQIDKIEVITPIHDTLFLKRCIAHYHYL